MIIQFLKPAMVDNKRYAQGQIAELDDDVAHNLIVAGIAKEREDGPGEPDLDDES